MKDLERRKRAKESQERRKQRLAKKPIETLLTSDALLVTYDPNTGSVTIGNGLAEITLGEPEAIEMRDALLERLA